MIASCLNRNLLSVLLKSLDGFHSRFFLIVLFQLMFVHIYRNGGASWR